MGLFIFEPAVLAGGDIEGKVTAKLPRYQKDVVVYLDKIEGKTFKPPDKPVVMDQHKLAFVPRVLPVLVGTQVNFLNSDDVLHNVFTPDKVAGRFNLGTYPQGEVRSKVFDKPGSAVILCNVHPEMEAYVVAVETPYFAVTDENGNFVLKDIPEGTYTVKVWSEKYEAEAQQVDVPSSGRIEITFHLQK
ncbi:MAG: beta-sandwich domain-containing protein [Fidelibacterota bacterium]